MRNYLSLSSRYLKAHRKSTRLAILSVSISVALVVGMISLLGELTEFERQNILHTEGNYHILVRDTTERERTGIAQRADVKKSGVMLELENGLIKGKTCAMGAIDPSMGDNMNFHLLQGYFPVNQDEIMLEQWYAKQEGLKENDTVVIKLPQGAEKEFILKGIYMDWGETKASNTPIVLTSLSFAQANNVKSSSYFILFQDGVKIKQAEAEICQVFGIRGDRIARNEGLLALMLQSKNSRVLKYYIIGAGLFGLVLITAAVMIYNSMSISVLERLKHFGLLRCIGTSKSQIVKLVRREAVVIAIKAMPFGILAGIFMTFLCLAVLKIFNPAMYEDISLFQLNLPGIAAGIVLGFATVLIACINPARRASRISPVCALTGDIPEISKRSTSRGILSRIFPIELTMGLKNACKSKKTLFLMSGSVGLSIVLFLLFQALINPDLLGTRPVQRYTADMKITSVTGIPKNICEKLVTLEGVEGVNGRMSTFVNASIKEDALDPAYRNSLTDSIETDDLGYTTNAEQSWLVSYDDNQLKWAKSYLSFGTTDPQILNAKNGLIVVNKVEGENGLTKTTSFALGDKVKIKTETGIREMEIVGIADSLPYSTDKTVMTIFVTTEDVFRSLSSDIAYKEMDVHLKKGNQDTAASQIHALSSEDIQVGDLRQLNIKRNNAYVTVTVFIYGFVTVIALISILNIINTMNASVVAKRKMFGVMRAVGMTGDQLMRLVVTESLTFCMVGCLIGTIAGVYLRRRLELFVQVSYHVPLPQIVASFAVCIVASLLAVIAPVRRIQADEITETISML